LETARCGAPRVERRLLTIGAVVKAASVRLGGPAAPDDYGKQLSLNKGELTLMAIVDRFNIKVVAGAGLCGAAIALSPDAAAAPLITGGQACIEGQSGELAPAAGGPAAGAGAVAGGAPAAGGAGTVAAGTPGAGGICAAPMTDMSGVPMAVPGPLPVGAPVPIVPPLPLAPPVPIVPPVPVVPAGAPLIALGGPAAAGEAAAPLIDMSGVKDAPTGPAPTGGPAAGQPTRPGPSGAS
jgi:hypothetical protein